MDRFREGQQGFGPQEGMDSNSHYAMWVCVTLLRAALYLDLWLFGIVMFPEIIYFSTGIY
jgi:hypothetical protein